MQITRICQTKEVVRVLREGSLRVIESWETTKTCQSNNQTPYHSVPTTQVNTSHIFTRSPILLLVIYRMPYLPQVHLPPHPSPSSTILAIILLITFPSSHLPLPSSLNLSYTHSTNIAAFLPTLHRSSSEEGEGVCGGLSGFDDLVVRWFQDLSFDAPTF
jgi:hypothetical protein